MKQGKSKGERVRSRIPQGAASPAASSRSTSCEEMSRLYAAGEMSPAETSDFEAHLAGCDTCKKLIGEWKDLFSLLSRPAYDAVHLEPSRDFDRPIMAFVKGFIRERQRAAVGGDRAAVLGDRAGAVSQRAEVARRGAIWVGVAAVAAVLVIFSEMLSNFAAPSQGLARPYVLAITWIVGIFHKGFDWLVFNFVRGIKIGEIFVLVFEKLRPIWRGLEVAARQLDPQLVAMEVLLLMLSLVLLRGFLGTAPKGRCTNVGIIL
jgi:hypothetical protein